MPPLADLLSPAPGGTTTDVRPPVEIEVTDPAPGSGVAHGSIALTLDGAPVVWGLFGTMLTYAPAADLAPGPHTLGLDQRDVAGNRTTRSWTFTVESVAPPRGPNLAITSPAEGAVVRSWFLTVDLAFSPSSAPIDRSSLRVVLDPLSATPQDLSPYAVDTPTGAHLDPGWSVTLNQGTHDLMASLSDTAGRRTDVYVRFAVDWSGPHLAVVAPADGSAVATRQPVIQIAFSENGVPIDRSSLRVTLYPPGALPVNLTPYAVDVPGGAQVDLAQRPPLADARYWLYVSMSDTEHHWSSAYGSFLVDMVAPVVTINNGADADVVADGPDAVVVRWQDAGGIAPASLRAILDRGTAAEQDVSNWFAMLPYEGTLDLSGAHALSEGRHTLDVSLADQAGHVTTASHQFTVDDSPPEITQVAPAPGAVVDTLNPHIEFAYSDRFSRVLAAQRLRVNGVDDVVYFKALADRMYFPSADPQHYFPTESRHLLHYGDNLIEVEVADDLGHWAHLEVTITAKPLLRLTKTAGDGQFMVIGRPARTILAVQATAPDGLGVEQVPISFAIVSGGGELTPSTILTTTTNDLGGAGIAYRFPPTPGPVEIRASVAGQGPEAVANFTETASLPVVTMSDLSSGHWYAGNDLARFLSVGVKDSGGGGVGDVEVSVPENEATLWVLRWVGITEWPGGGAYFGLIPQSSTAPTEVTVRLPEFPLFVYGGEEVSEVKLKLESTMPKYIGDKSPPWITHSIVSGGQGQTVAPGGTLQPVDLDFSELKSRFDAMMIAGDATRRYYGVVFSVSLKAYNGVVNEKVAYFVKGGTKVKLTGLAALPGFWLDIGYKVLTTEDVFYPVEPSGSGASNANGTLTLDLSQGGTKVTGDGGIWLQGDGEPDAFVTLLGYEPPGVRLLYENDLQHAQAIPNQRLALFSAPEGLSRVVGEIRGPKDPTRTYFGATLASLDHSGQPQPQDGQFPPVSQHILLPKLEAQSARYDAYRSASILVTRESAPTAPAGLSGATIYQRMDGFLRFQEEWDVFGLDEKTPPAIEITRTYPEIPDPGQEGFGGLFDPLINGRVNLCDGEVAWVLLHLLPGTGRRSLAMAQDPPRWLIAETLKVPSTQLGATFGPIPLEGATDISRGFGLRGTLPDYVGDTVKNGYTETSIQLSMRYQGAAAQDQEQRAEAAALPVRLAGPRKFLRLVIWRNASLPFDPADGNYQVAQLKPDLSRLMWFTDLVWDQAGISFMTAVSPSRWDGTNQKWRLVQMGDYHEFDDRRKQSLREDREADWQGLLGVLPRVEGETRLEDRLEKDALTVFFIASVINKSGHSIGGIANFADHYAVLPANNETDNIGNLAHELGHLAGHLSDIEVDDPNSPRKLNLMSHSGPPVRKAHRLDESEPRFVKDANGNLVSDGVGQVRAARTTLPASYFR